MIFNYSSRTKEFDGIDRDLPWTTMAMARIVMSISLIAETSGDDTWTTRKKHG